MHLQDLLDGKLWCPTADSEIKGLASPVPKRRQPSGTEL